MLKKYPLAVFNTTAFLKEQLFLLPVLLLFYESNGLTLGDYFFFQGLIVLLALFLSLPCGYLTDIFKKRTILIFSYSFFLGRILLWLFFKGYYIILIGEILYAFSKAFFDSVSSSYLWDILKQQNKKNAMLSKFGVFNCAMYVGTATSSLLGAWFYNQYGPIILLSTETILISSAILLCFFLPEVPAPHKRHSSFLRRFKEIQATLRHLNRSSIKYFFFFSGALVALSNFFFWSLQPIMKQALLPIALFGVIIFINNTFRCLGSLFAKKILDKIPLYPLGCTSFILNSIALFLGATLYFHPRPIFLYIFMIYLCICIGVQLVFTIGHIARLHAKIQFARALTSSANMMITRLLTAILLIIPKYLIDSFSLSWLFAIYFLFFLPLGSYLLFKMKGNLTQNI